MKEAAPHLEHQEPGKRLLPLSSYLGLLPFPELLDFAVSPQRDHQDPVGGVLPHQAAQALQHSHRCQHAAGRSWAELGGAGSTSPQPHAEVHQDRLNPPWLCLLTPQSPSGTRTGYRGLLQTETGTGGTGEEAELQSSCPWMTSESHVAPFLLISVL